MYLEQHSTKYLYMTKERFLKILDEENVAGGPTSALGPGVNPGHGGDIGNSDFYATDDARLPKFIGKIQRRFRAPKKKKK
jgi:hypothetical protein